MMKRRGFLGAVLGLFGIALVKPAAAKPLTLAEANEMGFTTTDGYETIQYAALQRWRKDVRDAVQNALFTAPPTRKECVYVKVFGPCGWGVYITIILDPKEFKQVKSVEDAVSFYKLKMTMAETNFLDVFESDQRMTLEQKYDVVYNGVLRVDTVPYPMGV